MYYHNKYLYFSTIFFVLNLARLPKIPHLCTTLHKSMNNTEIYKLLRKYRLIGLVADSTGLHRNTIKNILDGDTEESMYLELVQTAALAAITEKQAEIADKIESLRASIGAPLLATGS